MSAMKELLEFLNSLDGREQDKFARKCGTSVGYLRKAACVKQRLREALVIAIDRESGGVVSCETLRPDVDWGYLRGTRSDPSASTTLKRA